MFICLHWEIIGWCGTTRSVANLVVPPRAVQLTRLGTSRSNRFASRTRVLTSKTWCQRVSFGSLSKPMKPSPPKDHQLRPFFFHIFGHIFSYSSDFWHDIHWIWLNQWFLCMIWWKSHWIRKVFTESWTDLAKSRRIWWDLVAFRQISMIFSFTRKQLPLADDTNNKIVAIHELVVGWESAHLILNRLVAVWAQTRFAQPIDSSNPTQKKHAKSLKRYDISIKCHISH